MKILLAILLCPVLVASQCFAIDGGPWSGGGGTVAVTGTYAGVFVPIPTELDPGPPPVTMTDNSLALFTLRVPTNGLATGTSAVFRNGLFYPGTIQASADADSARLTGILSAGFTRTVGIFEQHYDANGQFVNTRIVPNHNTSSVSTARIRGKASLTYVNDAGDPNGDSGGPILYKVKGFKQSENSG